MRARQETCCFTGHRPEKLPWRDNEQDPRCIALKRRISDAVEAAWNEGYRHFICGMARGCDLYFCECVRDLRPYLRGVTLEAAIPYPEQAAGWSKSHQKRYQDCLDACDLQTVVSRVYKPSCMARRNRYMVDHASLLIAVFDGVPGGSGQTIEYAMRRNIPIISLPPVSDSETQDYNQDYSQIYNQAYNQIYNQAYDGFYNGFDDSFYDEYQDINQDIKGAN